MIHGIGTDICDIRRIASSLERFGPRFARRILSASEMCTYEQRAARSPQRGISFVATRFAAKEAFSKAVGLGLHAPMTWRDCEVGHHPGGQPCIVLHGALHDWFCAQGLRAHVSLSDERDHAVAFVVVEKDSINHRQSPSQT